MSEEEEVKRVLGINSWRNLSKDGVMRLASMMPDLPKEVALKIVEQFPEFRMLATATLNVLAERHSETVTENRRSQRQVHRAYRQVREALSRDLERDDLTPSDRRDIYDRILETADREAEKDSQNKAFLMGALRLAGGTAVVVVLGAAAVLGVKSGGFGGSDNHVS